MQEQPSKEPVHPSVADIEELARRLREAEHLEPEARVKAADLLGELAALLARPGPHAGQLAERTAELVRAVNDRHETGLIRAARERLEGAIVRAEAKAPVATDVVLQLIGVLAGIGI